VTVCVVGSLNLDLVGRVARLPRPGETVLAMAATRHVGGKGANQAVAAARAGAPTRLVGCVGQDGDGAWLLAYLTEAGVDTSGVESDPASATGQAFITIDETSENTIVVSGGANIAWRGGGDLAQAIGDPRVLLAQLELDLDVIGAALEACGPQTLRIVNAAPAIAKAVDLFAACDLVIVNETELAVYGGAAFDEANPPEFGALDTLARSLFSGRCRTVVVTLGKAGALVIEPQGPTHIPPHPVAPFDTVGAGDCFCGVLAAGLAQGRPLIEAARRANVAAALAVTRPGAAEAMPTQAEIAAALQTAQGMRERS
jgi:ribokinase